MTSFRDVSRFCLSSKNIIKSVIICLFDNFPLSACSPLSVRLDSNASVMTSFPDAPSTYPKTSWIFSVIQKRSSALVMTCCCQLSLTIQYLFDGSSTGLERVGHDILPGWSSHPPGRAPSICDWRHHSRHGLPLPLSPSLDISLSIARALSLSLSLRLAPWKPSMLPPQALSLSSSLSRARPFRAGAPSLRLARPLAPWSPSRPLKERARAR